MQINVTDLFVKNHQSGHARFNLYKIGDVQYLYDDSHLHNNFLIM